MAGATFVTIDTCRRGLPGSFSRHQAPSLGHLMSEKTPVILLGFWPYFLLDQWPHVAAVSLDRMALMWNRTANNFECLRSIDRCAVNPSHQCAGMDARLSEAVLRGRDRQRQGGAF